MRVRLGHCPDRDQDCEGADLGYGGTRELQVDNEVVLQIVDSSRRRL